MRKIAPQTLKFSMGNYSKNTQKCGLIIHYKQKKIVLTQEQIWWLFWGPFHDISGKLWHWVFTPSSIQSLLKAAVGAKALQIQSVSAKLSTLARPAFDPPSEWAPGRTSKWSNRRESIPLAMKVEPFFCQKLSSHLRIPTVHVHFESTWGPVTTATGHSSCIMHATWAAAYLIASFVISF